MRVRDLVEDCETRGTGGDDIFERLLGKRLSLDRDALMNSAAWQARIELRGCHKGGLQGEGRKPAASILGCQHGLDPALRIGEGRKDSMGAPYPGAIRFA